MGAAGDMLLGRQRRRSGLSAVCKAGRDASSVCASFHDAEGPTRSPVASGVLPQRSLPRRRPLRLQ